MKKGIESFPLRIYLLILIVVIVLPILLYQISTFINLSSKKQVFDDINTMINKMNELRATSDEGGFSRTYLKIPQNSSLLIDNITNKITLKYENEEYNFTTNLEFINSLYLQTGEYEIVLYYGNKTDGDNYTIAFV